MMDEQIQQIQMMMAVDEQTRIKIDERLRGTLEHAPSDASASLQVRQVLNGYKGVLKIHSQQRNFIGGCVDSRLDVVIECVFEEVERQIDDWRKRRRFADVQL